jgi:adenosylhomocysteine nucleosidase
VTLSDGPVGVVAALPAEARALLRARARHGALHPFAQDRGLLSLSGMGADAARSACAALLAAGARSLLSWGCAGGLDATVRTGTVIIAAHVAGSTGIMWSPARQWSDRVAGAVGDAVPVVRGTLVCPDEMVHAPADKRALARRGMIAVDMESAAVAETAEHAGVPWIVVRAVADTAAMVVPTSVTDAVGAAGRLSLLRLARALLRRPEEILLLPPLARGFRGALRALRVVADCAGEALLDPREGYAA